MHEHDGPLARWSLDQGVEQLELCRPADEPLAPRGCDTVCHGADIGPPVAEPPGLHDHPATVRAGQAAAAASLLCAGTRRLGCGSERGDQNSQSVRSCTVTVVFVVPVFWAHVW